MTVSPTSLRFGWLAAVAAGLLSLGYSISFSLYLHAPSRGTAYASALLLLAGGLISTAAFTAVYERLRETDAALALWGTVLALAVTGVLIVRGRRLPRALGQLAFLAAALLVFVYVGRLVILDPKSPGLLAGAVISGY